MRKKNCTTLGYFKVEQETQKAVQLTLKEGDTSSPWFPLSQVMVNIESKTVMGAKWIMKIKFAESKVAVNVEEVEAAKKKRNVYNNEMLKLRTPDWEDENCVGIDCSFWFNHINDERGKRVFFSKDKIKDGCVPRWLLGVKMDSIDSDGVISWPTV